MVKVLAGASSAENLPLGYSSFLRGRTGAASQPHNVGSYFYLRGWGWGISIFLSTVGLAAFLSLSIFLFSISLFNHS